MQGAPAQPWEGAGAQAIDEGPAMTRPLLAGQEPLEAAVPSAADRRIEMAKSMLGDPHAVAFASDVAATQPLGGTTPLSHGAPSDLDDPPFDVIPEGQSASALRAHDPHEVFIPLPNLHGAPGEEEAPLDDAGADDAPAEEDYVKLTAWPERKPTADASSASTRDIASLASALPRIDDGVLPTAAPIPASAPTLTRETLPSPAMPAPVGKRTDTIRLPDEEPAPAKDPAPKKARTRAPKAASQADATPAQKGSGIVRDGFELPSMTLLAAPPADRGASSSDEELRRTAHTLQQTLEDFGIGATVVGWIEGPTVTLFQVDLPSGVRVSRITNLNDDIALALASPGVRIFAPIPGTNHVGIEIPNRTRQTVFLSEVLTHAESGSLDIAIGKDVEGRSIISDLAKMPHLLIGGTTGSGKSVSINAMIMSILMRMTPSEVRFIMIDPKRVEFTPYNGIPHLYVPVVTEPKEAASALSWGVAEMERRLKVFSKIGVRNITQYNAKVSGGGVLDGEGRELDPLPYIVIIIDELADLMMNVGKEVEFSISRIAQLARAAGIHLIVATQRPSTNVVTGLIKANITNRIAFNVASGIDSRVILDTPGAENLIGLGDMLLSKPELPKPQRIQACYVSEEEIGAVVDFIKAQGEPDYHQDILQTNVMGLGSTDPQAGSGSVDDPLVWEAAELVVSSRMGSTSNIQRRLKVGYARAGRILDQLEELGVVGPANGSKPREVYVDELELESLKAFELSDRG